MRALRVAKGLVILAVALLASGCAHYPGDAKLDRYDAGYGYRFTNLSSADNSDSLLVVVTFSGGGTRAAAFAYGVLEQLAKTGINWESQSKRLLDEVDIISSVSGGSYTAAYYALNRDRVFEDFESAFLKRNVQGELTRKILTPYNLARAAGPTFGRIDLVVEYLDDELFRGATYGDLVKAGRRPFILINASDMSLGTRFEFTQDQFDLLCSDLSQFPLARAVAASNAVPVLFSPLTVWNYGGHCGYMEPEGAERARESLGIGAAFLQAPQKWAFLPRFRGAAIHSSARWRDHRQHRFAWPARPGDIQRRSRGPRALARREGSAQSCPDHGQRRNRSGPVAGP